MGKIRLRVRSPKGASVIEIDSEVTIGDLLKKIEEITTISSASQKIKFGFPPKYMDLSNIGKSLSIAGIKSGETLIIEEGDVSKIRIPNSGDFVKDIDTSTIPQKPSSLPVQKTNDGFIVRRIIESDNSCLFNSVAYCLEGAISRKKKRSKGLRKIIEYVVKKNPKKYNGVVLGKKPDDYCKWVLKDESWGGELELVILSEYFEIMICAFDIQTTNVYKYGQGSNYKNMVLVLYDGIHYDLLALNPIKDGPEEIDLTIFNADDKSVFNKAHQFVKKLHKDHKFTDLSGFNVKCLVCNKGFVGQKGVQQHANETGHMNFAEIKK